MTPPALHPFLDHPGPIGFVHRGGAAEAAENSMAAFERALAMGFRYVETDARATADGILMAFHDARLERVTDRAGPISELSRSEVARARLVDGSPIPELAEVLAALPDARINIDVKADDAVGSLTRLLRDNSSHLDRVCVGSFSDARLAHLRAEFGAALCTSTGPAGVLAHVLASRLRRPTPGRLQGNCLQVPVRFSGIPVVTRRFVDVAHEQGRPVHVWTVDEPDEMNRLLDLGVDGLMTDRPEALRDTLAARGAWPQG